MRNLFLVVISLLLLAGCSNEIMNDDQFIKVQLWDEDENQYEDFKEITNNEEVQKVKEIVFDIEWEKAKVQMEHPADYRFIFQYKNPNIEAKAVTYKLWISSNNDLVEIVMEDNAYAKLNKENSRTLIDVLTVENSAN
ncbi:hypothetical protein [Ureibacillus acetophenoni]|uniref:YhfM-like domain-containing protein n=1 Tax=Ureibacillus acetophenoni TaxID=614649 RepID=A0A285UPK9_9BACL|nr:hypothetical protein [Ureibacillus acetophenoni]SOC43749.1 hypothetical protein SAMN05877842_11734 [Ureibacillus acetophenoni]